MKRKTYTPTLLFLTIVLVVLSACYQEPAPSERITIYVSPADSARACEEEDNRELALYKLLSRKVDTLIAIREANRHDPKVWQAYEDSVVKYNDSGLKVLGWLGK